MQEATDQIKDFLQFIALQFIEQRSFDSLEAVERTKRQRAPQRRGHRAINEGVDAGVGRLANRVADHMAADTLPDDPQGNR